MISMKILLFLIILTAIIGAATQQTTPEPCLNTLNAYVTFQADIPGTNQISSYQGDPAYREGDQIAITSIVFENTGKCTTATHLFSIHIESSDSVQNPGREIPPLTPNQRYLVPEEEIKTLSRLKLTEGQNNLSIKPLSVDGKQYGSFGQVTFNGGEVQGGVSNHQSLIAKSKTELSQIELQKNANDIADLALFVAIIALLSQIIGQDNSKIYSTIRKIRTHLNVLDEMKAQMNEASKNDKENSLSNVATLKENNLALTRSLEKIEMELKKFNDRNSRKRRKRIKAKSRTKRLSK